MERLLGDMATLSDSLLLLDKLQQLASHKQVQKLCDAPETQSNNSPALAPSTKINSNNKRKHPEIQCWGGKNNPEWDFHHTKNNYWTVLPKKGDSSKKKTTSGYKTNADTEEKTDCWVFISFCLLLPKASPFPFQVIIN